MKAERGKVLMARLSSVCHQRARLSARLSELAAEEARIYDELAEGEVVDLRSGRRQAKAHAPDMPPITELNMARADQALQANATRRRVPR
jgi:hypothetical protein